ncbi:hypothetical protein ACTXT7_011561 [Hymenolepis weldensis]
MQQAKPEEPKAPCNAEIGRKIIFPLDKSSNVQEAFEWFFKFGYRPADFVVFANIVQPTFTHGSINVEHPIFNPTEDVKLNFDEAHKIEDKYRELAKKAGVNFRTTCLADSDVADAINMLAEQEKANLIVATALGESTYEVIMNSKIPVLVVPSEDTDDRNCYI